MKAETINAPTPPLYRNSISETTRRRNKAECFKLRKENQHIYDGRAVHGKEETAPNWNWCSLDDALPNDDVNNSSHNIDIHGQNVPILHPQRCSSVDSFSTGDVAHGLEMAPTEGKNLGEATKENSEHEYLYHEDRIYEGSVISTSDSHPDDESYDLEELAPDPFRTPALSKEWCDGTEIDSSCRESSQSCFSHGTKKASLPEENVGNVHGNSRWRSNDWTWPLSAVSRANPSEGNFVDFDMSPEELRATTYLLAQRGRGSETVAIENLFLDDHDGKIVH